MGWLQPPVVAGILFAASVLCIQDTPSATVAEVEEGSFFNGTQRADCLKRCPMVPMGQYATNCDAELGYHCLPCQGKPLHSTWVSNGVLNNDTCSWLCLPGFDEVAGRCIPCRKCPAGKYIDRCGYESEQVQMGASGNPWACINKCFERSMTFAGSQTEKGCICVKRPSLARNATCIDHGTSPATPGRVGKSCGGTGRIVASFKAVSNQYLLNATEMSFGNVNPSSQDVKQGVLDPYNQLFQFCDKSCSTSASCDCFALRSNDHVKNHSQSLRCFHASHPCITVPYPYTATSLTEPTDLRLEDAVWLKVSRVCSCAVGQYASFAPARKCFDSSSMSEVKIQVRSHPTNGFGSNFDMDPKNGFGSSFDMDLIGQIRTCSAIALGRGFDGFCYTRSSRTCRMGPLRDPMTNGTCVQSWPWTEEKEVEAWFSGIGWPKAESACLSRGGHLATVDEETLASITSEAQRCVESYSTDLRACYPAEFYDGATGFASGFWIGADESQLDGRPEAGANAQRSEGRQRPALSTRDCLLFHGSSSGWKVDGRDCGDPAGFICHRYATQCFQTIVECLNCSNTPFAGSNWQYTAQAQPLSRNDCPAQCREGFYEVVDKGFFNEGLRGCYSWRVYRAAATMATFCSIWIVFAVCVACLWPSSAKAEDGMGTTCLLCGQVAVSLRLCEQHGQNPGSQPAEILQCKHCNLWAEAHRTCDSAQSCVMSSNGAWSRFRSQASTLLRVVLHGSVSRNFGVLGVNMTSLACIGATVSGCWLWNFVHVSEDQASGSLVVNPLIWAIVVSLLISNPLCGVFSWFGIVDRRVCCTCSRRQVACGFCENSDLFAEGRLLDALELEQCRHEVFQVPTGLQFQGPHLVVLANEPCSLAPTLESIGRPHARFRLLRGDTLPEGLELDSSSGTIAGSPSPTCAGVVSSITVIAVNPFGRSQCKLTLSILSTPTAPQALSYPRHVPVNMPVCASFSCCNCLRRIVGPRWDCTACRGQCAPGKRGYAVCQVCYSGSFHTLRHSCPATSFNRIDHVFEESIVQIQDCDPHTNGKLGTVVSVHPDVTMVWILHLVARRFMWFEKWDIPTSISQHMALCSFVFFFLGLLLTSVWSFMCRGPIDSRVCGFLIWTQYESSTRLAVTITSLWLLWASTFLALQFRFVIRHAMESDWCEVEIEDAQRTGEIEMIEMGRESRALLRPQSRGKLLLCGEQLHLPRWAAIPVGSDVQLSPCAAFEPGFPAPFFTCDGDLPPGLSLDAGTGVVAGSPTESGSHVVFIEAHNTVGTCTCELVLDVAEPPSESSFSFAQESRCSTCGCKYHPGLQCDLQSNLCFLPRLTKPIKHVFLSISPDLPPGLAFCERNGAITGRTEVAMTTSKFTITAITGRGLVSADVELKVSKYLAGHFHKAGNRFSDDHTVLPSNFGYPQPLSLSVGRPVKIKPHASLGHVSVDISVSPDLPPGLRLDGDGNICGTPLAFCTITGYHVKVSAGCKKFSVQAFVNLEVQVKPDTQEMHAPKIPGYSIVRRLGAGGHGTVWLAVDDDTQEQCAIKVCSDDSMLAREMKNLQEAQGLPNIVSFLRSESFDGVIALVTEFVQGIDLKELMNAQPERALGWEKGLSIFEGVMQGLSALHSMDPPIIHRDLKPANIMIEEKSNRVVLVDFGVAKRIDHEQTLTTDGTRLVGSLPYMSPEVLRGDHQATPRLDVFAAGVILFELITGRRPFGWHLHEGQHSLATMYSLIACIRDSDICDVAQPAELEDQPALWRFLNVAMARAADARFESCVTMHAAYSTVCAHPMDPTCIVPFVPKPRPAPLRKPRVLAFFAQEKTDLLNVHREGQHLISMQGTTFDVPCINPQPRFEEFHGAVMRAATDNVVVVHMAGHGEREKGFYFLKDDRAQSSEAASPIEVAAALCSQSTANHGTIECVVLNACFTEEMGRLLRAQGMEHVVCWRTKVHDEAAMAFARTFYQTLEEVASRAKTAGSSSLDYRRAFEEGRAAIAALGSHDKVAQARARKGVDMAAKEQYDVIVFLSGDTGDGPVQGDRHCVSLEDGGLDLEKGCTESADA